MFSVAVVWCFALLLASVASLESSCSDPLSCYLASLTFSYPETVSFSVNGIDVTLTQLTLHGLDIARIPSLYVPPVNLNVSATELGTALSFHYSAVVPKKPRPVTGDLSVSLSDTNVSLSIFVPQTDDFLPESISFSLCGVSPVTVTITQIFEERRLQDLPFDLETLIQMLLDFLICNKMNDFLLTNVTQVLENVVDPALRTLMANSASPLPLGDKHTLHWNETIVQKLHALIQRVEGVVSLSDFFHCLSGQSKFNMIPEMASIDLTMLGLETIPLQSSTLSANMTLLSATILGLDTLVDVRLLEPVSDSPASLFSALSFDRISIDLEYEVSVSDPSLNSYEQKGSVVLSIDNPAFSAMLTVDVNAKYLDSLSLDQLSSIACWLATVRELSISSLLVDYDDVRLEISQEDGGSAGAFEHDLVTLMDEAFLLMFAPSGYGNTIRSVIQGVLQGPVRTGINDKLLALLTTAQQELKCLTHVPSDDEVSQSINWPQSELVQSIYSLTSTLLGSDGSGLNHIMSCATGGTGVLSVVRPRDVVTISGLNSFYAFSIFETSDDRPYDLSFNIALGFCANSSDVDQKCNPLSISVMSLEIDKMSTRAFDESLRALVHDSGEDFVSQLTVLSAFESSMWGSQLLTSSDLLDTEESLVEALATSLTLSPTIAVSIRNFSLNLDLSVEMSKSKMSDLKFEQIHTTGCVASTMSAMSTQVLQLSVASCELTRKSGEVERDLTRLVDGILTQMGSERRLARVNDNHNETITNAPAICAAGGVSPVVDNITDDGATADAWKWQLSIVCLGSLAALFGLALTYSLWGPHAYENEKQRDNSFCGRFWFALSLILSPQDPFAESGPEGARISDDDRSLIRDARVPLWVRLGVPCAIVGAITLFVSSNTAYSATSVMLQIILGDKKTLNVGSIFEFGLSNTVRDMWKAKVYPLAALVAVFSGGWPYMKLTLMLAMWITPPKHVSIRTRESVLCTLDALGKWSLLDVFVMVLMLCAFYMQLFILNSNIIVNVTVLPRWGFYGFVIATMLSLGLGHCILACHRLICERDRDRLREREWARERRRASGEYLEGEPHEETELDKANARAVQREQEEEHSKHSMSAIEYYIDVPADLNWSTTNQFSFVTESSSDVTLCMGVKLTNLGQIGMFLFIMGTAGLVYLGNWFITMGFDFLGLIGLMLKDAASPHYSYITLTEAIPRNSGIPGDFAVRWLQASVYLFGTAMPFFLLFLCVIIWHIPLSLQYQRIMLVLCEIAQAWGALDVFCVSIAAALLEIRQFAAFVVGDACDRINVLLAEYMDQLLDGDDKCFDVIATLESNSWTIFCAAAALLLLSWITLSAGHAAIEIRRGECGSIVRELETDADRKSSDSSVSMDKVAIDEISEALLSSKPSSRASSQSSQANKVGIMRSMSLMWLKFKFNTLLGLAFVRFVDVRFLLMRKPNLEFVSEDADASKLEETPQEVS